MSGVAYLVWSVESAVANVTSLPVCLTAFMFVSVVSTCVVHDFVSLAVVCDVSYVSWSVVWSRCCWLGALFNVGRSWVRPFLWFGCDRR